MYKLDHDLDQGWAINIYGGDRRLLCSLNPSHFWSLLAGLVLGVLLSVTFIQYEPSNPQPAPTASPKTPPLSVD